MRLLSKNLYRTLSYIPKNLPIKFLFFHRQCLHVVLDLYIELKRFWVSTKKIQEICEKTIFHGTCISAVHGNTKVRFNSIQIKIALSKRMLREASNSVKEKKEEKRIRCMVKRRNSYGTKTEIFVTEFILCICPISTRIIKNFKLIFELTILISV